VKKKNGRQRVGVSESPDQLLKDDAATFFGDGILIFYEINFDLSWHRRRRPIPTHWLVHADEHSGKRGKMHIFSIRRDNVTSAGKGANRQPLDRPAKTSPLFRSTNGASVQFAMALPYHLLGVLAAVIVD
jgi:hypothetical protein